MPRILIVLVVGLPLLAYLLYAGLQQLQPGGAPVADDAVATLQQQDAPPGESYPGEGVPKKSVLDISVHTIDELKVVLDRAESLAMAPQPPGETANIVLVLHGPEVEFFAIGNYKKYKDIVDQAARLDAFDIVDVKICQAMMQRKGVPRDDIPAFIEQVPLGPDEIRRLARDGYVYF